MEEKSFDFYDSIDSLATRWLAWNLDKHKVIGFEYLTGSSAKEKWLLCIARNLYTYSKKPMYIKTSLINYLWLRYIKKFKFLRWYRAKKHQDVFLIDGITFIEEVTEACNTVPEMIDKIYEAYYER